MLVADPRTGIELPEKLQVLANVAGELQGVFLRMALTGAVGAEGRVPALGLVHGCQLDGAGSLVIQKT